MSAQNRTLIEISTTSILKVLLIFGALWFLYATREIVTILFIALLLASILQPFVSWMRSKRIPASVSVLLLYSILGAIIALIVTSIIPPILDQTGQLSQSLAEYWRQFSSIPTVEKLALRYDLSEAVQQTVVFLQESLKSTGTDVLSKVTGFFGGVLSFFVVLVITFYLLAEESAIKRIIRSIVPSHYQPYLARLLNRIQDKLGLWIRGQLILSGIVFALVYVGLLILGVKYALVLAVITGLLEFIPYIGPVVSALIAVFLSVFHSPFQALLILILYIVIQQTENHILVPKVMQKAIGLNPVVSIVALLVGARLAGILGVVLAIPVVTSLSVFVTDFLDSEIERRETDHGPTIRA